MKDEKENRAIEQDAGWGSNYRLLQRNSKKKTKRKKNYRLLNRGVEEELHA